MGNDLYTMIYTYFARLVSWYNWFVVCQESLQYCVPLVREGDDCNYRAKRAEGDRKEDLHN